ncbi:WW domain-binding protein 4 [Hermetia illucens]|uniref:WW domain-binding protein 4 n=1 Tax=Hermetia illucens TaxID=343691 RepID=UPI0018CBF8AE|nr:WW domain-binding protein 4 [Hermetia illucens]
MADYWKSNDRKYCDFCKCWITDNKPSIAFHENGRRHKANVAKRISEISRNSAKSEKEQQKMDQELRKMEDAAMRSYAKDVSSMADLTARSVTAVLGASTSKSIGPQVDPLMPPGDFDPEHEDDSKRVKPRTVKPEAESSMWVEAKSPDGHPYYWNVKTNETIWEAPKEGFMPLDEYNRINEIAVAQQQLQLQEESKQFRENADEIVAKYRREQLKAFRHTDSEATEKKTEQESFKTEEEAQAPTIGAWQVVEEKKEPPPVDLQLPSRPEDDYYIPPAVSNFEPEPPTKKFKEKTVEHLESDVVSSVPATFKKRKIAKGNARQRLDND